MNFKPVENFVADDHTQPVDAAIKSMLDEILPMGLYLNKDAPEEVCGPLTAQAIAYRVLQYCIEAGLDNEDSMIETMRENLFAI